MFFFVEREGMAMRMTSLQDRLRIQELAAVGWSDAEIAAEVLWSERTVRKWRLRLQTGDRSRLESQLGRPRRGAMGSFAAVTVEEVRQMRQAYPGRGALTLHTELALQVGPRARVPSRATIARYLAQQGLVRRYERHGGIPLAVDRRAQALHHVWEMDARGQEAVAGVGVVMLIHLNDRLSRTKLMSYPCVVGLTRALHRPTTGDYQLALRLAFAEWGLPAALSVDHDSVFYDNTSHSPFPSQLHLWLAALGVLLLFGPYRRPTDRGMTERSHQTWAAQVIQGQHFRDWNALWAALQARKTFLNEHLPCRTHNHVPPLVAYPAARLPQRPYDLLREEELFDPRRIAALLAQGRWFRTASQVGAVKLGGIRYPLGAAWASREVEIHFDPADSHLLFCDASRSLHQRLPIQGVAYHDLAGDMHPCHILHPCQLPLPIDTQRFLPDLTRLLETMSDTSN